jgi:hypothetical protein
LLFKNHVEYFKQTTPSTDWRKAMAAMRGGKERESVTPASISTSYAVFKSTSHVKT